MFAKRLLVLACVLVFLVGCSRVAQESSAELQPEEQRAARLSEQSEGKGAPMPPEGASGSADQGAVQRKASVGTSAEGLPPVPQVPEPAGNKVIKNATVHVEVGKGTFQSNFAKAGSIAEEFGGFVTNSSVSAVEDKVASGEITIRVPSDRYQQAVAKLKGLGTVKEESQSGQDVTREFVDLEARLRHLKSQEAFYLRLLNEAKSISDMVQVQQQLASVQLQIEQIEGQLQYLRDQTSYSTISARIFEPDAAPGTAPKGIGKAWSEAVAAFKTVISGLIVALGWLAPFTLIASAIFLGWRFARRERKAEPTPTV